MIVVATAPPVVDDFSVNLQRVVAGQEVILTWRTRLARKIRIDPLNYEDDRPTGSLIVKPSQTTTYLLTAYGDAALRSAGPVKVEVTPSRRRAARH
jgi:hypothetical protein